MKKKTIKLSLVILILIPLLVVFDRNANAGWTEMNGTEADVQYFGVWTYSATDVFFSGCLGNKMYYDGNLEETCYVWPKIQGH